LINISRFSLFHLWYAIICSVSIRHKCQAILNSRLMEIGNIIRITGYA